MRAGVGFGYALPQAFFESCIDLLVLTEENSLTPSRVRRSAPLRRSGFRLRIDRTKKPFQTCSRSSSSRRRRSRFWTPDLVSELLVNLRHAAREFLRLKSGQGRDYGFDDSSDTFGAFDDISGWRRVVELFTFALVFVEWKASYVICRCANRHRPALIRCLSQRSKKPQQPRYRTY